MIVADTNIISYLLLPTMYSDSVDAIFKADANWVAPILWKSELKSVLTRYFRKDLITLQKAIQLQDTAESIISSKTYNVSAIDVFNLAKKSSCSSYDSEFVALAQHLNIFLVTQDKKVLREFPSTAISAADFLSR